MTSQDFFREFSQMLDGFAAQGRTLSVWWRDDDAIQWTEALETLVNLSEKEACPLYLAVIPKTLDAGLDLKAFQKTFILQHGFQHRSRALAGEKKCEFPLSVKSEQIVSELSQGRKILEKHFGKQFLPIFVPPWNRFPKNYRPLLKDVGFQGLSCFTASDDSFLTNTHFDIIDWKRSRGFIGFEEALNRLRLLLHEREESNEPLGFLTHHLDHDGEIWGFLREWVPFLKKHPQVRWASPEDLFPHL